MRIYQQIIKSSYASYTTTFLPKKVTDTNIRLLRIYKTIKHQVAEFNECNRDGYVIVDNPILSLLLTDPLPLPVEEYILYLHQNFNNINFFYNAGDDYSADIKFILDNYDIPYANLSYDCGLPTLTIL